MEKARKLDVQFTGGAEENEFSKIRNLMRHEKRLLDERGQLEKAIEKVGKQNANDKDLIELRRKLKDNQKEKKKTKNQLINELKGNFKHITGMWPNNADFKSEEERMAHWQTKSVIKQKIFKPAKTLLICDQGAEKLEEEKLKYDDFLSYFRQQSPRKSPLRMQPQITVRGSADGSNLDYLSRANTNTPQIWRGSNSSNLQGALSSR